MSKLSVKGSAVMDFTADIFQITITICASAASSGEVIVVGKRKTEQFLRLMKENLHIEPNDFQLVFDSVKKDYSNKNSYIYTKRLSIEIKADLCVCSKITSLLEELSNIEYNIDFGLSNQLEKEKQVIEAAIHNSREKAEIIASSLGKKIQGADKINFESFTEEAYRSIAKSVRVEDTSNLETMLKNPTKKIQKSIDIDWIME